MFEKKRKKRGKKTMAGKGMSEIEREKRKNIMFTFSMNALKNWCSISLDRNVLK